MTKCAKHCFSYNFLNVFLPIFIFAIERFSSMKWTRYDNTNYYTEIY